MTEVFGEILPFAAAMALSPIPIISVIVVLFSATSGRDSVAFLVGWMLGLALVGALILVIAEAVGGLSSASETSTTATVVRLLLGTFLLAAAVNKWRARPAPGEESSTPPWMRSLDSMSPGRSLVTAAVLAGVNPKNLMLNLAAMTTIVEAGLPADEQALALLFLVLVGSVTIIAPVALYLIRGEKAVATLEDWKIWLTLHNSAVMAVLYLVFSVVLLGQGISGLATA